MARILFLIAQEGFQTMEYHDTKRVLKDAGHTIITGALEVGIAHSNIGEEVVVDIALRDVHVGDYDAVYAIGGPGVLKYLDNDETLRIMRGAMARDGMPYGAICIAPRILAKAGVLSGLRATGWNTDGKLESIFSNAGAEYEQLPVVIDGRVVTAEGPVSAEGFGEAINRVFLDRV